MDDIIKNTQIRLKRIEDGLSDDVMPDSSPILQTKLYKTREEAVEASQKPEEVNKIAMVERSVEKTIDQMTEEILSGIAKILSS